MFTLLRHLLARAIPHPRSDPDVDPDRDRLRRALRRTAAQNGRRVARTPLDGARGYAAPCALTGREDGTVVFRIREDAADEADQLRTQLLAEQRRLHRTLVDQGHVTDADLRAPQPADGADWPACATRDRRSAQRLHDVLRSRLAHAQRPVPPSAQD